MQVEAELKAHGIGAQSIRPPGRLRHIDRGGTGEVWEVWLIPSAELGTQLLNGQRMDLRKVLGGIGPTEELRILVKQRSRDWVQQRMEQFVKSPPQMR